MKLAEMRELKDEELSAQVTAAQKELFEARFKHSMHQLDDTDTLRRLRHRIAQLKTVLAEKAGAVKVRKAPSKKAKAAVTAAKSAKVTDEPAVAEDAPKTKAAPKAAAAGGEKKSAGTPKKKA